MVIYICFMNCTILTKNIFTLYRCFKIVPAVKCIILINTCFFNLPQTFFQRLGPINKAGLLILPVILHFPLGRNQGQRFM